VLRPARGAIAPRVAPTDEAQGLRRARGQSSLGPLTAAAIRIETALAKILVADEAHRSLEVTYASGGKKTFYFSDQGKPPFKPHPCNSYLESGNK
jgi:hypothetical protein